MDEFLVRPNTRIDLSQYETYYTGEIKRKDGRKQLAEYRKVMRDLQELLYAENKQQILVVLQGIDTSGKDGTIKNVFGDVNPQGTQVVNFRVPTRHELARDYLWRVHKHTPAKGEIVIFNRSHYEDVLVVRVNELAPESVWKKRYQHINEFERLLVDEGATILKFFLHISKSRQAERFLARLDRPNRRWKFNPEDIDKREDWDDYKEAFEAMLSKTSTHWAPWYVIPSDRKWYRNMVIAEIIIDKLKSLGMQYPKEVPDIDSYRDQLIEIIENE